MTNAPAIHELAKATDSRLAEIYGEELRVAKAIAWKLSTIHSAAGDRQHYVNPSRRGSAKVWGMTDQEAIDATDIKPWEVQHHADAVEALHALHAEAHELHVAAAEAEQVWRDNGCWNRFFLVPDGHIHASMGCSTCNRGKEPTLFGWLPELSGLDEAAAVEAQGARLCTVCFPSAPVHFTNAFDLEAAAKAADKCAGSGTYDYDRATARLGYVTGNHGTCTHCGQRVTVTKTNKLRGHKAA